MTTLRLYRGIKEKYKTEKVNINNHGTDFTDCPFRATLYAKARNGYLLVVDAPIGQRPLLVTEEQYLREEGGPKRFMLWSKFDSYLVAIIPAKEIRARLREEGCGRLCDADKGQTLKNIIGRAIEKSVADDALPVITLKDPPSIYKE